MKKYFEGHVILECGHKVACVDCEDAPIDKRFFCPNCDDFKTAITAQEGKVKSSNYFGNDPK